MSILTNKAFDPTSLNGSFVVLRGVASPTTRAVVTKMWLFNTAASAIDVEIYLNDQANLTSATLIDTVSVGPLAGRSIQSAVGYSIPEDWFLIASASANGVNCIYSTTDYSGNS